MKIRLSGCIALVSFVLSFVSVSTSLAQKDPGVRCSPPRGVGPLRGLTANELALLNQERPRFIQVESVDVASSANSYQSITKRRNSARHPNAPTHNLLSRNYRGQISLSGLQGPWSALSGANCRDLSCRFVREMKIVHCCNRFGYR